MRRWGLLLCCALVVAAQPLPERIAKVLEASSARRAFWGIQVLDLERRQILAEVNPQHFFLPASNTKLFTTALALMRLGPDYRFRTLVAATEKPDAEGRLRGDLYLIGGGDPTLSNRTYPYVKGPKSGNPLQGIEELAQQVYQAGVRRVEGDVVGDDTAYVWEPYPDGWALDDALWEYGAPVSALTVNDNVIQVQLRAGSEDEPVSVRLSPSLDYYLLDVRIQVQAGVGRVWVERLPGSHHLRVWGTLAPKEQRTVSLAIVDPALYAARAFRDALRRRGVAVAGRAVARHRYANQKTMPPVGNVELARRESPPLIEVLRVIDKVSQNLHAEIVLREVGRVVRGEGSREAGLAELAAFLDEIGIARTEYRFLDGSGLSRLNLVTPTAIVRLLEFMYRSPHREAWVSLLPIGGEDGTLSARFGGAARARLIRAKTGTLSLSNALSGYADSSGGPVAFAILANNALAAAAEVRAAIDKIALLLVE